MSNVFGCVGLTVDDRRRKAIRDITHLRSWIHHEDHQVGKLYLHRAYPDSSREIPAFENSQYAVFIIGELYVDEFPMVKTAEIVLERFLAGGHEVLNDFNGNYLVFIWDKIHNALIVANDPFGIQPLYYATLDGGLLFSTKMRPILAYETVSRAIDHAAVSDFLTLGYCLGDRTLLQALRRLRPGSVLQFENGKLSVTRCRYPRFSDRRWHWASHQVADAMFELYCNSFRLRMREGGRKLVPLSGGLDSRMNVAFCRELCGRDFEAFTYGAPYHADRIVAKQVARTLGIPHSTAPMRRDYMNLYLNEHLRIIEGATDITTAQFFPILNFAQNRFNLLISGTLEGVLTGGNLQDMKIEDYADPPKSIAEFFAKSSSASEEFLRELFSPVVSDESIRAPWDETQRAFGENPAAAQTYQRLMHVDCVQRQRGYIFTHDTYLGLLGRPVIAALDQCFLEMILSAPLAALENQVAYRMMFNRHFKDLAVIINANDDRPIANNRKSVVSMFTYLAGKAATTKVVDTWTRLRGRVSQGYVTSMWDVMSFPDHHLIVAHLRRLRQKEELWGDFINRSALDRLIGQYEQSSGLLMRVPARRLFRLFTFLEFIGDEVRNSPPIEG
jgi:hypothetical protein